MNVLKPMAAALVGLVVVVATASPASAQFFDAPGSPYGSSPFGSETEQPGTLTVDVKLGAARGTDTISAWGENSDPSLYEDLGRSLSDAFKLKRNESNVTIPDYDAWSDSESIYDVVVESDERIADHSTADPVLKFNAGELERVARNWDYSALDLTVCTAGLPHEDRSSPKADKVNGDCLTWNFDSAELTSPQSVDVDVVQKPDSAQFVVLAALVAGVMLAVGVALAMFALLIRRKFKMTLKAPALLIAGIGLFLSICSAGIAMIVFALIRRPITDFASAMDLSQGAYVMVVLGLGLTAALPFFLPTLVFCRAGAPDYTPKALSVAGYSPQPYNPNPYAPGVPAWLNNEQPRPGQQPAWMQQQQGSQQWFAPSQPTPAPNPAEHLRPAEPTTQPEHAPTEQQPVQEPNAERRNDDPPQWSPPS